MHEAIDTVLDGLEQGRLSRRDAVVKLSALALAFAGAGRLAVADEPEKSTFRALDVNHIALRVSDLARSRDFYRKHLGLRVTSESEWSCFMSCADDNFVALFKGDKPSMDHYCYTVPGYDPDRAVSTLKAAGLEPERQENRVYFPDPDGLTVQIAGR